MTCSGLYVHSTFLYIFQNHNIHAEYNEHRPCWSLTFHWAFHWAQKSCCRLNSYVRNRRQKCAVTQHSKLYVWNFLLGCAPPWAGQVGYDFDSAYSYFSFAFAMRVEHVQPINGGHQRCYKYRTDSKRSAKVWGRTNWVRFPWTKMRYPLFDPLFVWIRSQ